MRARTATRRAMGGRWDRSWEAFTLVELMMTVAIVTVLAGLLLPTLSGAQARARAAFCGNNLHQLQLGWQLYADDHENRLAPNYSSVNAGKSEAFPSWVGGWLSYDRSPDNTNALNLLGGDYGRIGHHVQNARVYRCPADHSSASLGPRWPRVRSFSMNCYLGESGLTCGPEARCYRKSTDLVSPSPSQTWVLIEEHEDSIDDGSFLVSAPGDSRAFVWHDLPASRHGGSAKLTFADGHLETRKWRDPRTRKPVERYKFAYAPSPLNSDGAWLQERSTAPAR